MLSRLADLSALVQGDGFGAPVDPDAARRQAEEILSRAEYQAPEPSFLDHLLGWIGDRVADLAFGGGPGGAVDLLAWTLVIALLALVAWVVVKSFRRPGHRGSQSSDSVVYGTENVHGPEVWMAEAERLAAAGDYRGALRCRHQALISTWILADVIEHVVGQTARECHDAALRGAQIDAEASRRVADGFNAVWYGGAAVSALDYERFSSDCDTISVTRSGRRRLSMGAT